MIDLNAEQLVAVVEIPKHIPGHRPHVSTCWRWIQRGIRDIRLETLLVGGKRYTSVEAIQRFIERTTTADSHSPPPTPQGAALREAEAKLDAAHIGCGNSVSR